MAKFYVGQRVRVVRTVTGRHVGREATIVRLDGPGTLEDGSQFIGHWIAVDGLLNPHHSTGYFCTFPDWIEPLTPPKQQEVVSWESLPFTREGKWIGEPAHV